MVTRPSAPSLPPALGRRAFIAGVASVLGGPLVGEAQLARVHRVGVIFLGGAYADVIAGLRDGLKERGLEEGKHFVLVVRDTKGDLKLVEGAARTLEAEKVDLLYTVSSSVTLAARQGTTRVPIVFYAGTDPVTLGLVNSFPRPGGRLTGVHGQLTDLTPKRLELLKALIPSLRRVVTFYNAGYSVAQHALKLAQAAAQQLKVEIVGRPVASIEELRAALTAVRPGETDAYFHLADAMVTSQTRLVVETMNAKRLPSMFNYKDAVVMGALASYGESYYALGHVSAKHVQQVLRGADPGTLPVEQFDRPQFFINARTARALGLTIPQPLLLRADQVIQ